MNRCLRSLLSKEWIKLRAGIWILPLLLLYAAVDSFLVLKTIQRTHESFGLYLTLLSKEPLFFKSFRVLFVAGTVLGFLQVWPEVQGKRLRLLFHTPLHPECLIGVTLAYGMSIMLFTNLAAHALLAGNMFFFKLPADIIVPVILTLTTWSILSFVLYLGTAAFFYNDGLVIRLFVFVSCFAMYSMMGQPLGYGLQVPSFGQYALISLCFIALVFYSALRFMSAPDERCIYRMARAISLLLFTLSLCAVLPNLYERMTAPKLNRQKLYYSPVKDQFIIFKHLPESTFDPALLNRDRIKLEDGTSLTSRQMIHALPTLYVDHLIKWNAFPETIKGIHIPPEQARTGAQHLSFRPTDWNAPEPMLHMLLESDPEGARLQYPSDFFRLTGNRQGLEFIRPQTAVIDRDKSECTMEAMRKAGFIFPVRNLNGKPDPRKEYDEGYLLVDAKNRVFQLKMVKGEPVCNVGGEIGDRIVRGIVIAENRRREMLGFVITDEAFFAIMQDDLSLRRIPVAGFNADRTSFSLWADGIGKYVVVSDILNPQDGILGQVMTHNFVVGREYYQPLEEADVQILKQRSKIDSILFPLRLSQQDLTTAYVRLRLVPAKHLGLAALGNLFCLVIMVMIWHMKKYPLRIWEALLVAVFGPTALGALILDKCTIPSWLRPSNDC